MRHRLKPWTRRRLRTPPTRCRGRDVTSATQIAANRRNAMRSTGPRTATGKARSRCNALRHGLSLPLSLNNFVAAQIEKLTEELTAFAGEPRERVRVVAEAHLEV